MGIFGGRMEGKLPVSCVLLPPSVLGFSKGEFHPSVGGTVVVATGADSGPQL